MGTNETAVLSDNQIFLCTPVAEREANKYVAKRMDLFKQIYEIYLIKYK